MNKNGKVTEKKFSKYVGSRIRRFRENSGLTQKDLANAIGVTITQVQNYEYGSSSLNITKLLVVAEALHISAIDLFPMQLIAGKNSEVLVARVLEHQRQIAIHTRMSQKLTNQLLKDQVLSSKKIEYHYE